MLNKTIPIKSCRSCGSKSLKRIISLGNLYLSEFRKDGKKPSRYPLTLVICQKCTLVQLKHTTPPSQLYTENYGYKSGINQTMKNELKEITQKAIKKITIKEKQLLFVDIGANDGTLLSNYPKKTTKVAFEPIKKLAKECKNNADVVINDYFNYKSFEKRMKRKKAHLITAISCFYDIPNPNTFMQDIVKILDKKGILVIQQNYLVEMLKRSAFDNIVHEHLEYYSLTSLQNLLALHNLEVFDVEQSNINGGSFRAYISFKNKRLISKRVIQMQTYETQLNLEKEKIYRDFVKNINKNKLHLLSFINKLHKKGKKIYLYGASTRGNTLLQYYSLNKKLVPFAVERNSEKWGTRIASVGIPILSEDEARVKKPDYLLVLPWFFKEEFIEREKKYLGSGGHFIFPLPKFKVV